MRNKGFIHSLNLDIHWKRNMTVETSMTFFID